MKKHILFFVFFVVWRCATYAQTWTTYPTATTAVSGVKTISIDAQNRKWVGGNGGISMYDGSTWINYNIGNGLIHNSVLSSAIDRQGTLWVGTMLGVSAFNGTTWTSYPYGQGLTGYRIAGIAVDEQNRKWFGTNKGVNLFDGSTWVAYNDTNSGIINNNVVCVYIDAQGNKWFGTWGGVSKFDGTTWTNYHTGNSGLPNNSVTSIVQDSDGKMWFGTAGGLCVYNQLYWNTYPTNLAINAMLTGVPGELWFGTEPMGILHFNSMDASYINTQNSGILSDIVLCMTKDPMCGIWIGHPEGVSQVSICLDVDESETFSMQLYPNPTAEGFTLTYPETDGALAQMSLYSTTGQLLQQLQQVTSGTYIPLSNLAAGLYLVKVQVGNKESITRIVKK